MNTKNDNAFLEALKSIEGQDALLKELIQFRCILRISGMALFAMLVLGYILQARGDANLQNTFFFSTTFSVLISMIAATNLDTKIKIILSHEVKNMLPK